jgi:hypothetical protein
VKHVIKIAPSYEETRAMKNKFKDRQQNAQKQTIFNPPLIGPYGTNADSDIRCSQNALWRYLRRADLTTAKVL